LDSERFHTAELIFKLGRPRPLEISDRAHTIELYSLLL